MSPHRTPGDLGPGPMPKLVPPKRWRLTKSARVAIGCVLGLAAHAGFSAGVALADGPAELHMVWLASPLVVLGLAHAGEVTKGWSLSWFIEERP